MCDEGGSLEELNSVETKKRKNRWGSPIEEVVPLTAELLKTEDATKKGRTSRWSTSTAAGTSALPSLVVAAHGAQLSQEVVQQTLVLKLQLQHINEKLTTVVQDAIVAEKNPDRSPSPPPKYDSNGKRTNTREMRMRENYNAERVQIIEELIKLNPQFTPPVDFIKGKPTRRIYIPKQTNPLYNFIGIIIGPRGNTQKQMEQETGCKISIRGKGSAKEGSRGRASKNMDEDEELHVHITGDEEEKVELAAQMVSELLKPIDENLNLHKQRQLRELALINGTLREDEYCPICGEKGHRQFECPHRSKAFKSAGIKCSICGDMSHPTRDCPMKLDGPTNEAAIDSDYDSFISELTDGGAARPKGAIAASEEPVSGTKSSVRSGGPIVLAPVVDMFANKRQPQTVIRVTSVMTGSTPPQFLMSSAASATTVNFAPPVVNGLTVGSYPYQGGLYPTPPLSIPPPPPAAPYGLQWPPPPPPGGGGF